MEFQLLLSILTFLSLALVASQAALSPDAYWKSVLPNTPMPKAFKDILSNEWMEDKSSSTSVGVGKGGVNVDTGKGKAAGSGSGTNVNVGGKGVGVDTGKPGGGKRSTQVGVGKGGVNVNTGPKGKPVYVGVTPGAVPFLYKYAATETQMHDNPKGGGVALFFLEKDLTKGTSMTLHFTRTTTTQPQTTFLPRQVAVKIPFSSDKMPQILHQLSVEPKSKKAEMMEKTIKECEEAGIKGEEKYCATSLESMIDFTTSKLGKSVEAISTKVDMGGQLQQKYRISEVKKMGSAGEKSSSSSSVVCHKQKYAYAVFYCHKTSTTKAYVVSLDGTVDGTKAKAVAVCHTDTSAWNPNHLAFQLLKVKPGTLPVCHFLPEDHVVWVQN